MKKLRILIVDDNPAECTSLSQKLSSMSGFEVVKAINEPRLAVGEIMRHKPDVLLLDAVMPFLDGDDILSDLSAVLNFGLVIIVLGPMSSDLTINYYSSLGAHYFLAKPINYDRLTKKIKKLYECSSHEKYPSLTAASTETRYIPTPEEEKAQSVKIAKLLMQAGINPKLKGFSYLKDSISFICASGNELSSVTKIVYPKIAEIYGTEAEKVERAIRTAIEKAFSAEDGKLFYYGKIGVCRDNKPSKRYPSNREFIFTLAEYAKTVNIADFIE